MLHTIRKFENLHIACWLVKDTCWVLDLKYFGMFMILPTVALAFYITWRFRSIRPELYHNLAVCFWIIANTVWMTGEFYYDDTLRPIAMTFFLTGLAILTVYYVFYYRKDRERQLTDII